MSRSKPAVAVLWRCDAFDGAARCAAPLFLEVEEQHSVKLKLSSKSKKGQRRRSIPDPL